MRSTAKQANAVTLLHGGPPSSFILLSFLVGFFSYKVLKECFRFLSYFSLLFEWGGGAAAQLCPLLDSQWSCFTHKCVLSFSGAWCLCNTVASFSNIKSYLSANVDM